MMVTLDAGGLAIKAVAASTSLAYVVSVPTETTVQVNADPTQVYVGTADANFAKAMRNTEVDLAIDGAGNQLIDVGASLTDVFKVVGAIEAGTVGSTLEVQVVINKPIAL
jgi:hypothetical protein